MCGISGYISKKQFNEDGLKNTLVHRGPDSSGTIKKACANKNVFLAHNRLSIIDLSSAGDQPMSNFDNTISVIFNGEIYNYQALKRENLREYTFRSNTDTEVIVCLYDKFGIDFIDKLTGDFAIAILDMRLSKFFLIRDRVGVKPLYYYFQNDDLVFGSEIKSIISAGINPELAVNNIQKYFIFKYTPRDDTLFKNISRVTPASYLEFNLLKNAVKKKRYWSLEKNENCEKMEYNDAMEHLYSLIDNAVKLQLMSDVPVGVFLSGGLDSSIIASFLKSRADITYYCARKDEKDLQKEGTTSDFSYALRLAKDWNLNLYGLPIGAEEVSSQLIKKTLAFNDDLIADGSQIPTYLITKQVKNGSKVLLSGMGADELFLGYAGYMLTLMSLKFDMFPHHLSAKCAKLFRSINQGKGRFLAYRRYLHRIGKYYNYPSYKYGMYDIVGDFENSSSVYKGDKKETIQMFIDYFPEGHDIFDSMFIYELENFLVKNLHYVDGMSMANSVESRVPFLDHRIIEFAHSIPRRFKLSGFGNTKKILKDTFKSILPNYILKRRKAGFGMPLRSIFSERTNIDKLLDINFFSNFDGFSVQNINRIIDNHLCGRGDNSSIIYALVSFQEWYKLNFTNS